MKRVIKMISIILLLLLLLCVISIWCSYHVLSLTTFTLSSEKVNTPMRAVLISDQHDHIFRDDNEELIERILELEPDVVFMDGDMLNADSDDISWLLSEIERLSAKVPVFYALGNHELAYMAAHPDLITQLEEAGAIVLDEQYVDVEIAGNAVRIGGFYDYAFSRTDAKTTADTMDAQDHAFLSDFCDTSRLKIMLSHSAGTALSFPMPLQFGRSTMSYADTIMADKCGCLFLAVYLGETRVIFHPMRMACTPLLP